MAMTRSEARIFLTRVYREARALLNEHAPEALSMIERRTIGVRRRTFEERKAIVQLARAIDMSWMRQASRLKGQCEDQRDSYTIEQVPQTVTRQTVLAAARMGAGDCAEIAHSERVFHNNRIDRMNEALDVLGIDL
jgi:hypothetical protein